MFTWSQTLNGLTMLGIDIYRYQTVYNWQRVKDAGVSFVYVKGTDGDGPALVRADGQVRGAQGVSIPVGLYHYAQLTPSPEVQARVLHAEVQRLGAVGMPPALDLESPFVPGVQAYMFALTFLSELVRLGHSEVVLYANTSMLNGMNAERLNVPGLKIWAANYGPNDGQRHDNSYPDSWIHQYTSRGEVSGITGWVDLNWMEDDDMALSNEDVTRVAAAVWEVHHKHLDPANPLVLPMRVWLIGANMGAWDAAQDETPTAIATAVQEGLAQLRAGIREDVVTVLGEHNAGEADEIVAMIGQRIGW